MKKVLFFLCCFLVFFCFFDCSENLSPDTEEHDDSLVIFESLTRTTKGVEGVLWYSKKIYDGWPDPGRNGPDWGQATIYLNTNQRKIINGIEYQRDCFIIVAGPNEWGFLPSVSNNVWADTNIIRYLPIYNKGIFGFVRKDMELWSMDEKTLIFSATEDIPYYGVIVDSFVSWDRTIETVTLWLQGDNYFLQMEANVPGGPFISAVDKKTKRAKFTFLVSSILDDTRAKELIFGFPKGWESITFVNGKNRMIFPVIMSREQFYKQ